MIITGLTPDRNTIHAISPLVNYIINSLEKNNMSHDIFMDISKVFDTMMIVFYCKYYQPGYAKKY